MQSWKVRRGPGPAPAAAERVQPTWQCGQAAGEWAVLALWPKPLLQLALQGVELAIAAVDEILGSSLCLYLDDKNLRRKEAGGEELDQGRMDAGRLGVFYKVGELGDRKLWKVKRVGKLRRLGRLKVGALGDEGG